MGNLLMYLKMEGENNYEKLFEFYFEKILCGF